ncbi:MAG TPA: hypothetical protein VD884_10095 [Ohtaekwangia sp.]|nr:hypothetical protein [Ohtaekwangia sp.]
MRHFKQSYILLLVLTVFISSRTFAQDFFFNLNLFNQAKNSARAKEVMQDNEYKRTGYEKGNFYSNPLMLNGEPLDYNIFNIGSKGELTVIKGAAITGKPTQVPFYIYLRRGGNKIVIPGYETPEKSQTKIDISQILRHAKPGDMLVIESVNKEDGPVKRVLKLPGGGC